MPEGREGRVRISSAVEDGSGAIDRNREPVDGMLSSKVDSHDTKEQMSDEKVFEIGLERLKAANSPVAKIFENLSFADRNDLEWAMYESGVEWTYFPAAEDQEGLAKSLNSWLSADAKVRKEIWQEINKIIQ